MALNSYSKYKISLNPDSHKQQGLQTGDIVRRQYVDGATIYYSLMCVLDYGVEKKDDKDHPYFVGALLEGDAPKSGELLDFVRVTNLFNVDRSGALYLTASDSEAPYMDIIDQLGKKASLCWPENIEADSFSDPFSQYVVAGKSDFRLSYTNNIDSQYRVLTVRRMAKTNGANEANGNFVGLRQQFYQFVKNPQQVLISYKVRASRSLKAACQLSYADDARVDAEWTENITTQWEYKFRAVTIEYSGRHLRQFKFDMSQMNVNDQLYLSDFNIILLSSVANFADASTMRIGKLDGIVDPVFGQLEGYGAYLQKLYATHGAHISGTLTAGDENGFGGTFYAGKIHRNCFRSSVDVDFVGDISIANGSVANPVGIGNLYGAGVGCTMRVQSRQWLDEHVGQRYCYSMWVYALKPCQIGFQQNGLSVGTVQIPVEQTHKWYRIKTHFDLLAPKKDGEDMLIALLADYAESDDAQDESKFYLCAPQLEKGDVATQYQATDSELNYTDDYGAWFSQGGIGGTIQNPLLKLNYDGNGSIGTRSESIVLRQDGSGKIAQGNIRWNQDGRVEFGNNVTLNWDNLTQDIQDNLVNRRVTIAGEDTFTVFAGEALSAGETSPASIELTISEIGMQSTSSMRQWYVCKYGEFVPIEGANGSMLQVFPDDAYWEGESTLTFKMVVQYNDDMSYSDTFTIKKQYVQGYDVRLSSSNGQTFQNGVVQTIITATVFYQGKPVDMEYVNEHFVFVWRHFLKADRDNEILLDAEVGPNNVLTVNHNITSSETYRCELCEIDGFDYTFPIILD